MDSADLTVFLVRFAEGTSLGLPQKISLFTGGASQPLSLNKLVSLRALSKKSRIAAKCSHQHPPKHNPLLLPRASTLHPPKCQVSSLTLSLFPYISTDVFFFSAPIGLGSFELLSLNRSHQFRRIPDLPPRPQMSGYTLCVSRHAVVTRSCRIGSKQNTLSMRLL
ncbi:uncharacterized protein TNCV_3653851 [Trichonephila clavipes]|nr:uncharacterized protein TNCV_3653851 [Trichonephila clavipes]